ncbi:MAG: SpoIID/LytB domain-containing protein [Deltaproteobacteria bacterium]|nr:SpoIID/LytB domain-containing protein [Deltaproteobacteria bacterium]
MVAVVVGFLLLAASGPAPAEAAAAVPVSAETAAAVPPSDETVRIAVGRFPSAVTIEGAPFVVRRGADDTTVALRKVRLAVGKKGLMVDGQPWGADVATIETRADDGALLLAGHRYRRVLEVRYQVFDKKPELLVVHPLDLETYVAGIVSAELPRGWPLAAYQAQAVAARTFAMAAKYRRLELPYHMEASVIDQVYGGIDREHALAIEAAASTRGVVLTWQRRLVNAYFHAACGGVTESALEGWGSAMDYLPGSSCERCSDAARYRWRTRVARKTIDKAFARVLGGPVKSMKIVERTATGRTRRIRLEGHKRATTISGSDLRRLLGWSVVWSTMIDKFEWSAAGLVVEGRGSGHGVGLCQWGARGWAEAGASWQEILARYYPGAALVRLF